MAHPARIVCGVLFAICLIIGGIFSVPAALLAAIAAGVLGGLTWLTRSTKHLRTLWIVSLAVITFGTWLLSAHSTMDDAARTCEKLPAVRLGGVDSATAQPTPQAQFLAEVHQQRVERLAQTAMMLRAYETLPQARAIAAAIAKRDAARSQAVTQNADRLQTRLLAAGLGAPSAMEVRAKRLQASLNQLVYEVDRDGAAVDIDARKAQLARIIAEQSFGATFNALSALMDSMNEVVAQSGGMTFETSYDIAVEPTSVRYDERVDMHLKRGHFVNVDLIELALQTALATPGAEIIVGGDGMLSTTFDARTIKHSIDLPTRPRSIWVLTRTRTTAGTRSACAGVAFRSFEKVRLRWPHPFDMQVRGVAELPVSDERIAFDQRIDKTGGKLAEVLLPYNTVFVQDPVRLRPSGKPPIEGVPLARLEPIDTTLNVAAFDMTVELLPKSVWFRNGWFYDKRDLFLPLNWKIALLYVAIASFLGAKAVSKPTDPLT